MLQMSHVCPEGLLGGLAAGIAAAVKRHVSTLLELCLCTAWLALGSVPPGRKEFQPLFIGCGFFDTHTVTTVICMHYVNPFFFFYY